MKVVDIVNSAQVVQQLLGSKMKIGAAYKIKKNAEEIQIIVKAFEEKRTELLEKTGTLNEEKNEYEFKTPKDRTKFDKGMNEHLQSEVDIDIKKVSVEDLGEVEIAPAALEVVEFMIEL